MKKKTITALVAAIIIITIAASSVAYFNSKDTADNVFTAGNVKISLTEPGWDKDKEHIIAPNGEFTKDPQVENTGGNDAYVRINVTVNEFSGISDVLGTEDVDSIFGPLGEGWTLSKSKEDTDKNTKTYTYVYSDVLKVGETTPAVFSKVTFPDDLNMDEVMSKISDSFSIDVSADAIQSAGFENAEEAFVAFEN